MKFSIKLKRSVIATAAIAILTIGAVGTVFLPSANAVPYTGETTPPNPVPAFNIYTGTPSVGDEQDFFRGKESTSTGYVDPVASACANGTKFTLRVYVHNAASQYKNDNGSGPSVAKNTTVKVVLPGGTNSNLNLSSTIASSNAASVTDGLTINCADGKKVNVKYVTGSATQYTVPGGTQALSDSIVTTGAKIGTNSPNGDVWGCWDQRVWVLLQVEVTEPVKPPTPELPYALTCKLDVNQNGPNVAVAIQPIATNVTAKTYSINFGDGTPVVNERTASHTYVKYGDFKIVGTVKGVNDKGKEFTANCEYPVTVKKPDMKLVCKMLIKTNGNAVGAAIDASGSVNIVPSSVTYSINFNDGTIVNAQTATHTYADYGKHVVTGTVKGTGVDGTKFTANCEETFTSEKPTEPPVNPPKPPEPPVVPPVQPPVTPEPPVVPPTTPTTPTETMPATGAASMVGLVSAVSVLGAIGHRAWIVRRVQ